MQPFTFIDSDGFLIECSFDGGNTWSDIPGPTSYVESGGDATSRTISALSGVRQQSGRVQIPTVAIECIGNPALNVFKRLKAAAAANSSVQIRATSKNGDTLIAAKAGQTAAVVAATGVVTLVGSVSSANVGPGDVLEVNNSKYVIDKVVDDSGNIKLAGGLTVAPPPAANIAAMQYSIKSAKIRRPAYSAKLTNPPDLLSLAVDSEASTTLNFAPSGQLPDVVLV